MKIRERICTLVEGDIFQRFITTLIVLKAITLGLETVPGITKSYDALLHKFDVFVLTMFTIEIVGKLQYRGIEFFKTAGTFSTS